MIKKSIRGCLLGIAFFSFNFFIVINVSAITETALLSNDNILSLSNPSEVKSCSIYGDIGSWSNYGGHAYRYIAKPNLVNITADPNQIIKATFNIDRVSNSWDDNNNYVLQIVSESWDPSKVNWGNQPKLDITAIKPISPIYGIFKFDITDTVKKWLFGTTTNYGLLIKKTSEDLTLNANKGLFACSDYPTNGSQTIPKLIIESCTEDQWTCTEWETCSQAGSQNRICIETLDCPNVKLPTKPTTTQSCTPPVPTCTADTWSCDNWGTCSSAGQQTRMCTKTYDCTSANTASPVTSQNCIPPAPACTTDTWTCDNWDNCTISGIQVRRCYKNFDCPIAVTPEPATSQFCESPKKPETPTTSTTLTKIDNQATIIKATVKLVCPLDENRASQGSGTIIDSSGTILTSKHVIEQTAGCFVGFIDKYSDEPYFDQRQIADIIKISINQDIATLKLRNPLNKTLSYIDITTGQSNNLKLGSRITTYGYPAKFGLTITYTSGDFSGMSQNYLKTSAVIEHGNSGGGAYLSDGTFVGIPVSVIKGELNALGYILPVDNVKAWINNIILSYGPNTDNNYSRVKSILDNTKIDKLSSLKLAIQVEKPQTKEIEKNRDSVKTTTSETNKTETKTVKVEKIEPIKQSAEQIKEQEQIISTTISISSTTDNKNVKDVNKEQTDAQNKGWAEKIMDWFDNILEKILNLFKK